MPHFLSWIIISGMALQIFALKMVYQHFAFPYGYNTIPFLSDSLLWIITYVFLESGKVRVITHSYLAAITGINPETL